MATRQNTLFLLLVVAVGLALSTMTSLRFEGVPLGPAEILLLGCMLVHLPLGHGIHGSNQPNRFVPWLLCLFALTLPGLFGTLLREGAVPWVMYNLLASAWIVALFAYLHYGFDHGRGEMQWLARLFLLFSSIYFLIVLILSVVDPQTVYLGENVFERFEIAEETVGTADENKDILRLQGFTTWPNQLAFHALITIFFCLAQWRDNGFFKSSICLGLGLAVGILTRSDAFLFAVIAMLGMWVTASILIRRSVVLVLLVLVPALVGGLLTIKPIVREIQAISETRNQDETRFTLWENGILAGLEHPLTGLGPGTWSGLYGPREFEEAHNSVVDYFTNAGVPGTFVLVIALVALLWHAFRSNNAAMFAGTSAIVLYAMFHNVLRQPIFWFSLYYVVQTVWPTGKLGKAPRRRRSRRAERVSVGQRT